MSEDKDFQLGRGLSSLIPSKLETPGVPGEQVIDVPVTEIDPNPHQPRTDFQEGPIDDLVESIKEHGILQPLIVTQNKDRYQLIAGERRLRASKKLGREKVPVIVRRASEQEKLELAIVENVQRSDLNPIERALSYKKLMNEFQLTQEEIGKKVGQKRSTVANSMRLLTLPEDIIKYVQEGRITEGHAKVLLSLDSEDLMRQMMGKITLHKLSVRETEVAVKGGKKPKKEVVKSTHILDLERKLSNAVGSRVSIQGKSKVGKIVIDYYSEEDLDRLVEQLSEDIK